MASKIQNQWETYAQYITIKTRRQNALSRCFTYHLTEIQNESQLRTLLIGRLHVSHHDTINSLGEEIYERRQLINIQAHIYPIPHT